MNTNTNTIKATVDCRQFLVKAPHGGFVCPVCGSGTGKNGTGGVKYYEQTNSWYCHACGRGGDVFSLYMAINKCDFKVAVADLGSSGTITGNSAFSFNRKPEENQLKEKPAQTVDYTCYYRRCTRTLLNTTSEGKPGREYLTNRGISMYTAKRYWLGFDADSDPAGAGYPTPRLIIPCSPTYYVARRIDSGEKYKKLGPKGQKVQPFNIKSRLNEKYNNILIVEGVFDALSVNEYFDDFGVAGIAINSANQIDAFLRTIKQEEWCGKRVFVALDNDDKGQQDLYRMSYEMRRLGVNTVACPNIWKPYKDANEFAIHNLGAFVEKISMRLYNE